MNFACFMSFTRFGVLRTYALGVYVCIAYMCTCVLYAYVYHAYIRICAHDAYVTCVVKYGTVEGDVL